MLTAGFARLDTTLRLFNSIWRRLYMSGDHAALAEFGALMAFSTRTLDAMPRERLDALVQRIAGGFPAGTPEQADLLDRVDVEDDLPRIRVPTLIVVTTGDRLVSPDLQRGLAAAIPGAATAEIGTGHAPFGEAPGEWLDTMNAFLRPSPAERRVRRNTG